MKTCDANEIRADIKIKCGRIFFWMIVATVFVQTALFRVLEQDLLDWFAFFTYYLDMIRATLFRQTQFAEFEQIMHAKVEAGEPLTKEVLSDGYYELNKQYYGDAIVHDEQIAYEWARIPHFYTSFYVYKYSTGIISAISIVKKILEEGESAVERYFEFLSSGGSTDPVSILKKAGVDLTTNAPFEAAMKEFADTLAEFEKLV